MNPRRLSILVVAALVAITVAVLLANRTTESTQATNQSLYPDLKTQAESVKAIRIFKAGDTRALEIVRDGAQWTLTERNGYPIAAIKARNLVRALSNARIVEEKTSDAAKFAALEVEDVSGADAKGIRIELEGPATSVDLIVGKDGPGGKSSYVRRAGEQKSWLVSEQLSASPEPRDWLQKEIINVSADRIQSATISIAGEKPYTAAKATRADADFKVAPLPKGKELSSASAASGVATALSSLSLDDVKPQGEVAATGKPVAQATFTTFDGLIVKLDGFQQDDKHYVTVATSYDAALAEKFKVKTAPDAKAEDENAKDGKATDETPKDGSAGADDAKLAAATPNVEEEPQTIATKTANWAYEIPGYKYDAIFRPRDELLKK